MVAKANWQDVENYRYVKDLNPAELAWEFLRRNPDYEQDVAASDRADDQATAALTAHWGVRFPDTPGSHRRRRGYLLEPNSRPGGTHSGAAGFSGPDHGESHR